MDKLHIPADLKTNACEAIHDIGLAMGILESLKEDADKREFYHVKNLEAALEFLNSAMLGIEPFDVCGK